MSRFIQTTDAGEEWVILELTRPQAEYLVECLEDHSDGGPSDSRGWKTDRFKALIDDIREQVEFE
jgi:hypothetical protein